MTRAVALSIAGSDSGGGAGIQMDLRVMHRLGVFATTAITAITAQNLDGVSEAVGVAPGLVAAQIDRVVLGFDLAAIKCGMLWSREIIEIVADRLQTIRAPIVIDPVMVATSGARLLQPDAVAAYRALWPLASLVTPNLDEAEILLGEAIEKRGVLDAAPRLAERLGCPVLLKGGHLPGAPVDVLADGHDVHAWTHPRVQGANSHGSGCMLSAAIAARLAHGDALEPACEAGLAFAHDAIAKGVTLGALGQAAVEAAKVERSHLRRVGAVPHYGR